MTVHAKDDAMRPSSAYPNLSESYREMLSFLNFFLVALNGFSFGNEVLN